MARPRTQQKIERDAEARGNEGAPLQDADRARQVAEPELVDEGKSEQRIDGDEPQGVQKPRQVTRHDCPPASKRDVESVAVMSAEQGEQDHEPRGPKPERDPALPEPSRAESASEENKGQAHHERLLQ